MSAILQVEHLKKYFSVPNGYLHAVDDVSFSLEKGQTLGVVGESGCGKSTLGRTLMRLTQPTSGTIVFNGKDYSNAGKRDERELRTKMQFIFQDPFSSLNPRMTVAQNIMAPLLINGTKKADAVKETAEIMETVGLSGRLKSTFPHELDGGRRQRIVIARALILKPKFIICDEPVSALDVSIQAQILNLLMDLQKERELTYIFITHDLSVVKHISNIIMVMYLGTMVEYCETRRLFKNPLHPYTKALLTAVPSIDLDADRSQRVLLRGEITSPINPKPGCRFADRCKYATELCHTTMPPLQEIEDGHFVACHLNKQINQEVSP